MMKQSNEELKSKLERVIIIADNIPFLIHKKIHIFKNNFEAHGMKSFWGGAPLSEDRMRMNFGAMNCKIFSIFKQNNKTHFQKQHTKKYYEHHCSHVYVDPVRILIGKRPNNFFTLEVPLSISIEFVLTKI